MDTKSQTSTTTFTSATTITFGASVSIEGKIPLLAEGSAGAEWQLSATKTRSYTESQFDSFTWEKQVTVLKGEAVIVDGLVAHGTIDVKYKAKVTLTFPPVPGEIDVQTLTFDEAGAFSNSQFTFKYDQTSKYTGPSPVAEGSQPDGWQPDPGDIGEPTKEAARKSRGGRVYDSEEDDDHLVMEKDEARWLEGRKRDERLSTWRKLISCSFRDE